MVVFFAVAFLETAFLRGGLGALFLDAVAVDFLVVVVLGDVCFLGMGFSLRDSIVSYEVPFQKKMTWWRFPQEVYESGRHNKVVWVA